MSSASPWSSTRFPNEMEQTTPLPLNHVRNAPILFGALLNALGRDAVGNLLTCFFLLTCAVPFPAKCSYRECLILRVQSTGGGSITKWSLRVVRSEVLRRKPQGLQRLTLRRA